MDADPFALLFAILLALKLAGVARCTWWVVFAPLAVELALSLLAGALWIVAARPSRPRERQP